MSRTAKRKRTTGWRKRRKSDPKATSVSMGYTSRTAYAQASRWIDGEGSQVTNIETTVEILREDDSRTGRALVRIHTVRGEGKDGGRGTWEIAQRDFFECDEHEADELEVVAAALTEAVRLAKKRGIIGADGAK